eukprot:gene21785-27854_t
MVRFCAERHGFQLIADTLGSGGRWPGCAVVVHFLKVLEIREVALMMNDGIKRQMAEATMRGQLWRAVAPSVKGLANADQNMNTFFEFWLELVLKLTNSASLVLKLFGWEQLGEIMTEAKQRRIPASSYVVEGAGTASVSGVYTLSLREAIKDDDSFQYVKASSQPGEPVLTLFRCTMRNKAKWWFISQADADKPGTDKDIDYYVQRGAAEDDREPPVRGWTRLNTGIPLLGVDPVPLLRGDCRLDGEYNVEKDCMLDRRLLQWVAQKDVLTLVFGASSLHREIISRSGRLLQFLCHYDFLSLEQVHNVWKAAMQSHDTDVADEIFAQLTAVSPLFSSDAFVELVEQALAVLQQQPESYGKVVQFLEKYSLENGKLVSSDTLHPICSAKLLSLVWEAFHNAAFLDLKSGTAIQDLLSILLHQKGGAEFSFSRIIECVEALRTNAESSYSKGGVSAQRELHILQFLISKHCDKDTTERLELEGFSESLIAETLNFISARQETWNSAEYLSQLSHRLQTLRRYFLVTPAVSLSLARVDSLWTALSRSPQERDEVFQLLQISQSVHVHNRSAPSCVCSPEVAEEVFRLYICSPTVDWAHCGAGALECFSTFFAQLDSSKHPEEGAGISAVQLATLRACGLQTLWRIAMNMITSTAAADAVEWLVKSYSDTTADYSELLQMVFAHLQDVAEELEDAALEAGRVLRLTRCIGILHVAVTKSRGVPGVAHSVRSRMGRISVTVSYRRVSAHHNHISLVDSVRSEKDSEGRVQLDVHPSFTVLQLKEKLMLSLSVFANTDNISLEHSSRKVSSIKDTTRLFELEVVDGSEVYVTYHAASYLGNRNYDGSSSTGGDMSFNRGANIEGIDGCTHIGQLLVGNLSQFDCLLTLCEKCKAQSELTRSIWELVMLLPSQSELLQEILEQVCFSEDAMGGGTGEHSSPSALRRMLEDSNSLARTAYLLQIVDSLLQPAPELMEIASDHHRDKIALFREAFTACGGFSSVLNILIATPVDDAVITSTTLAVSLHIIYFLLYDCSSDVAPCGVVASLLINEDEDNDDLDNSAVYFASETQHVSSGGKVSVVNNALLELVEQQSSLVIDRLMHVARHAAAKEESSVVHNALTIITTFIRTPEVAQQMTSNPESKVLLATVLRSGSKKVRDLAAHFAVQIGKSQQVVFG